jgi:hypothetical protein
MADDAPLPSIDANALAQMLGVTPKEVYDLTKAGVIERGLGRLYSVEQSVRRYCDHLRGHEYKHLAKSTRKRGGG